MPRFAVWQMAAPSGQCLLMNGGCVHPSGGVPLAVVACMTTRSAIAPGAPDGRSSHIGFTPDGPRRILPTRVTPS